MSSRVQTLPEPIKKVLRPFKDIVFRMPRDEASLWALEKPEDPDQPYLDVLRFGACDFRETEHAHTMAAPVGWPLYMAEEFERQGVDLAFQNLFVWHFQDFPDAKAIVKRRRKRRGRPDVIIVQTGGFSAMRHIFGFNIWSFTARENFGRRLGWLMHPIWRIMDPFLRLFGRPAPYFPVDPGLTEFLENIERIWPGVPVEFWEQNEPVLEGFWVRSVADRIIEETTPVLEAHNVPVVPAAPIPNSMALRGANGMNFNKAGSQSVGAHYANHLLARYRDLALTPAQRAEENAEAEAIAESEGGTTPALPPAVDPPGPEEPETTDAAEATPPA